MLSVVSADCVMEILPGAERWEGHAGAAAFSEAFISVVRRHGAGSPGAGDWLEGAPDVVNTSGPLEKPFAGLAVVGQPVHPQWVIAFPWILAEGKFFGKPISSIRALTPAETG